MVETTDQGAGSRAPKLSTEPYRGTRDFLPPEMSVRTQVFGLLYDVLERFGFIRYDGPLLEPFELYEAKSSQEIVNEQMYTLVDKGGRRLVLRPEMTPSVARLIAANSQHVALPARWYAHINCHRYERPQRGRLREHWQINADIFGSAAPECEVELFDLIRSLMGSLGATPDTYAIRVNDRTLVESAFTSWIGIPHEMLRPVLRALDRWEKIAEAEQEAMLAALDLSATQIDKIKRYVTMNIEEVCAVVDPEVVGKSILATILSRGLSETQIRFDPMIVRAFDYYTSTVFEVFDTSPTNARSLFGGGRYDNLVSLFKKERIPGVGFGMGDVTLFDFLGTHELLPEPRTGPDVYVFAVGEAARPAAYRIAADLRMTELRVVRALEDHGIGKQLKYSAKLGAKFAIIAGLDELAPDWVGVRDMARSTQENMPIADLYGYLTARVGS